MNIVDLAIVLAGIATLASALGAAITLLRRRKARIQLELRVADFEVKIDLGAKDEEILREIHKIRSQALKQ